MNSFLPIFHITTVSPGHQPGEWLMQIGHGCFDEIKITQQCISSLLLTLGGEIIKEEVGLITLRLPTTQSFHDYIYAKKTNSTYLELVTKVEDALIKRKPLTL